jgi:hypothetical protein
VGDGSTARAGKPAVLWFSGAIVHKGPLSTGDLRQRLAGLVG